MGPRPTPTPRRSACRRSPSWRRCSRSGGRPSMNQDPRAPPPWATEQTPPRRNSMLGAKGQADQSSRVGSIWPRRRSLLQQGSYIRKCPRHLSCPVQERRQRNDFRLRTNTRHCALPSQLLSYRTERPCLNPRVFCLPCRSLRLMCCLECEAQQTSVWFVDCCCSRTLSSHNNKPTTRNAGLPYVDSPPLDSASASPFSSLPEDSPSLRS